MPIPPKSRWRPRRMMQKTYLPPSCGICGGSTACVGASFFGSLFLRDVLVLPRGLQLGRTGDVRQVLLALRYLMLEHAKLTPNRPVHDRVAHTDDDAAQDALVN